MIKNKDREGQMKLLLVAEGSNNEFHYKTQSIIKKIILLQKSNEMI